jgi:Methyltransferase domain
MIVVIMILNVLFLFLSTTASGPSGPEQQRRTMTSSSTTTTSSSTTAQCAKLLDEQDDLWNTRRQARQISSHQTTGHREFFDLYEPEALCFSDERFGARGSGGGEGGGGTATRYQAFGDGPKFVCGVDLLAAQNGNCLVYSVGSSNHIDFEVSVKTLLGCEVHTFDPTLSRPFVGDKYSTFHPWGLGDDGEEETFRGKTFTSRSLQTIYEELGHHNRKIDILKIDCEVDDHAGYFCRHRGGDYGGRPDSD